MNPPICEWFAKCIQPADGAVEHPVLGWVLCCQSCADKLGLDLKPVQFVANDYYPHTEADEDLAFDTARENRVFGR